MFLGIRIASRTLTRGRRGRSQLKININEHATFLFILESDPEVKVIGTAKNGLEGLEKIKELKPMAPAVPKFITSRGL